jgi:LacI family transcriptional regulator
VESISVRVRLADVAAAAGVSLATASRALSGASGASSAAVAAVTAAAADLGYRPDPIARAMRSRSTGLVGIVVPGVSNPFFAEVVDALENALQLRELEMVLADSRGLVKDEARRIETLVDRKVDGLIVIPVDDHASAFALRRAHRVVPVVQIDRQIDGLACDYVGVDNAQGIRALLSHVADVGGHRVIFVSDRGTSSTGRRRLDAFRNEVRRARLVRAAPPMLGDFSIGFGRESVRRMTRRGLLPDTIVCGADIIALGVVRQLREDGVSVPDQVKVTGFDGILFAELCDPAITTVRQPVQAIATEAVGLLWSRLNEDKSPTHRHEIAPVLEIRRSSSPLS